ncbi:MAG TPA: hypothetical protein VM532_17130 [Burkholderiales bacterium]|nr:hypothetical protein [Burkholderiales bacterium]
MNTTDPEAPKELTEAEKLMQSMQRKKERLDAIQIERDTLPEYLKHLDEKPMLQKQFGERYIHGIEQDLADIDHRHQETLHRPPVEDFISKRGQQSIAEAYKELQAFKATISSRENYPNDLKSCAERAVQIVLDPMAPVVEEDSSHLSTDPDDLRPLLGEPSSFNKVDPMTNAFVEEVYSLQTAADRGAPEDKLPEANEVRQAILYTDNMCQQIFNDLAREREKYRKRAENLVVTIDKLHEYVATASTKLTAADHQTMQSKTDQWASEISAHSDASDERMEASMRELKTMYYRLTLRQTYMTEMIQKKNQMPSFQLMRDHQIRQQEYLRKVMEITKRLIQQDKEFQELAQRYKVLPDINSVHETLTDRSEQLIKVRHLQEMQSLQQQRLSAICNPREQAQSVPAMDKDATQPQSSEISHAASAIVPLLVAQRMSKSEAVQVRYDDPALGRLNKPNLVATTMFHEARGKSFLLVNGAPDQTPAGPCYQVIALNNPALLEKINATEFGAPVTGEITKGAVELRKGNVNKTSSERANDGPRR